MVEPGGRWRALVFAGVLAIGWSAAPANALLQADTGYAPGEQWPGLYSLDTPTTATTILTGPGYGSGDGPIFYSINLGSFAIEPAAADENRGSGQSPATWIEAIGIDSDPSTGGTGRGHAGSTVGESAFYSININRVGGANDSPDETPSGGLDIITANGLATDPATGVLFGIMRTEALEPTARTPASNDPSPEDRSAGITLFSQSAVRPNPATLVVIGLGLLAFAYLIRRRFG